MKVRASVKKICKNCKIIKRHGVIRIICKDPRHKAKTRMMTLTGIDLQSKIARFFNFRILGGNTHLNFLFIVGYR